MQKRFISSIKSPIQRCQKELNHGLHLSACPVILPNPSSVILVQRFHLIWPTTRRSVNLNFAKTEIAAVNIAVKRNAANTSNEARYIYSPGMLLTWGNLQIYLSAFLFNYPWTEKKSRLRRLMCLPRKTCFFFLRHVIFLLCICLHLLSWRDPFQFNFAITILRNY